MPKTLFDLKMKKDAERLIAEALKPGNTRHQNSEGIEFNGAPSFGDTLDFGTPTLREASTYILRDGDFALLNFGYRKQAFEADRITVANTRSKKVELKLKEILIVTTQTRKTLVVQFMGTTERVGTSDDVPYFHVLASDPVSLVAKSSGLSKS